MQVQSQQLDGCVQYTHYHNKIIKSTALYEDGKQRCGLLFNCVY